jgi:hypothetical protein
MPIVINDFEIVAEPHEHHDTAGNSEQPQSSVPTIRPDGVVQVMQLHGERMQRVRAD